MALTVEQMSSNTVFQPGFRCLITLTLNPNPNRNSTAIIIVVLVVVYVHNSGHPALYDMTTVQVRVQDINDHSPMFSATSSDWTLDVPENANMAAVHTVEAHDADIDDNARISYFITGNNRGIVVLYLFLLLARYVPNIVKEEYMRSV